MFVIYHVFTVNTSRRNSCIMYFFIPTMQLFNYIFKQFLTDYRKTSTVTK